MQECVNVLSSLALQGCLKELSQCFATLFLHVLGSLLPSLLSEFNVDHRWMAGKSSSVSYLSSYLTLISDPGPNSRSLASEETFRRV